MFNPEIPCCNSYIETASPHRAERQTMKIEVISKGTPDVFGFYDVDVFFHDRERGVCGTVTIPVLNDRDIYKFTEMAYASGNYATI